MASKEAKYRQLKRKADEAAKQVSRLEGQLEQILTQLKEEYDCDSIEEAEDLLTKLLRKEAKESQKLERMLRDFEERWGEVLSSED